MSNGNGKPPKIPTHGNKVSMNPQFDVARATVKIPVMLYRLGDGKVLHSNNCDPDIVQKFSDQFVRRNQGVRAVELVMMDRDKWNGLKEEQIAILLVN